MVNTQLYKGVMEGVILRIIYTKETYGYAIYETLKNSGFDEFSEGSLYPLLLRLEKQGYIKAKKKPSDLGPPRKYYTITENGMTMMEEFKNAFEKLNYAVNNIW